MAPVIFGLDLSEFKWSNFKSSYMFKNKDYHLRRTKFIVYQLAMIFCVVSESLGTDVLSNYRSQQSKIARLNGDATQQNNDYIGIASFNIFFGIYNAFIFGAAFFFDLQWPERKESPTVRLAWKITSVLACVFGFADLIAMTVIVSTRQAYITGVPHSVGQELLSTVGGYNPVYRHNPRAIASLVFLWLGYPFVIYSTILLFRSITYIAHNGPFTQHILAERPWLRNVPLQETETGANAMNLAPTSHPMQNPHPSSFTQNYNHNRQESASTSSTTTAPSHASSHEHTKSIHATDATSDAIYGAGHTLPTDHDHENDEALPKPNRTASKVTKLLSSVGTGGASRARSRTLEDYSPPMEADEGGVYRGT